MSIQALIDQVRTQPNSVEFSQVMEVISQHYHYSDTQFSNGDLVNQAGTNAGSCKIFSFAQLNNLSAEETLHLFGDYYRVDVLQHPEGTDHGNIRNFMQTGWDGIKFEKAALVQA
jgi:hypothetical protein